MAQVYYDATQLAHWAGGLTGIPRVMHELGTRFASDNKLDVTFVTWVKGRGSYYGINFEKTMEDRGRNIHYLSAQQQGSSGADTSQNARQLARRSAKLLLHTVSKAHLGAGRALRAKAESAHFSNKEPAVPAKGDVIVITWGEWWDDSFIEYLKEVQSAGVKIVQLIHDLGPLVQPQFSDNSSDSLSKYCRNILPIAHRIVTISKNTEKDIKQWLHNNGLDEQEMRIFREGDDFKFAASKPVKDPKFSNAQLGNSKFLLSVGTVEAKKNHQLLYYVYKLAASRGIDIPPTVVVGRRGWKTDDMYSIATTDPETKDKLIFLHDVDDEELSWLYDNCMFTVFMSFYEGWGIPIAESVSRGVPCICSNKSSMVEIAEGHVQYFDPASPDECLSLISELVKSDKLKKAQARAKSYKQFSWDESYVQFKEIVEEVI